MSNFFDSIVSFFEILYNFALNVVTSLLSMFKVLHSVISIPITFSPLLFPAIVTSMTIVIAIGVLYKIIGR